LSRFLFELSFLCGPFGIQLGLGSFFSAFVVLNLFFQLAGRCFVIVSASFCGTFLSVGLPAAEGTSQIDSVFIARMCEKTDFALFAPLQARFKVGFFFQERIYNIIVLIYKVADLLFPVPIRVKFKIFLNFYYKKARLSLIILMILVMSLSYNKSSTLSRSRTRTAFLGEQDFSNLPPSICSKKGGNPLFFYSGKIST
jgi:hypothetical protein